MIVNESMPSLSNDGKNVSEEPLSSDLGPDVSTTELKLKKTESHQSTSGASLVVSTRDQLRRSHSQDTLSLLSIDDFSELRLARSTSNVPSAEDAVPRRWKHGWKGSLEAFWYRNKGVIYVTLSMVFATLMNATARLLEHGDDSMHPFQILFARMSITTILCMSYMWWQQIPHFPFGPQGVRWLLVARGFGGFWGVCGFYWSVMNLPLSDATVLSFLSTPLASFACSKLINEPFTRTEQIAGAVSLFGVVLIAHPTAIFSAFNSHTSDIPSNSTIVAEASPPGEPESNAIPEVSPHLRLLSVGMSMVGVLGASVVYTAIRWIGQRAHSLISITYFSTTCTVVSTIALVFVPSVPFILPHTIRQWSLLLYLGLSGFIMQVLMTSGLAYERSSRANNMVYTQMLFALICDKAIWGLTPGALSIVGSGLILGGAVVVALQRGSGQNENRETSTDAQGGGAGPRDEETGLMENSHEDTVEMEEQDPHEARNQSRQNIHDLPAAFVENRGQERDHSTSHG